MNSKAKFCGHCGSRLPEKAKFCGKCGKPVFITPTNDQGNQGNKNLQPETQNSHETKHSPNTVKNIRIFFSCLLLFIVFSFVGGSLGSIIGLAVLLGGGIYLAFQFLNTGPKHK